MKHLFFALIVSLLCGALLAITPVSTVQAEVYKRTNPDGSVEFTDVPGHKEDAPVPLTPMSTFKAPSIPPIRSTPPPKDTQSLYSSLAITSPENETTLRDSTGTLNITVAVTPALQPEHKLILLMDGEAKGESPTGTFELTNVDRGEHSLSAQIQDAEGEVLISAPAVTVYLHRYSAIQLKKLQNIRQNKQKR